VPVEVQTEYDLMVMTEEHFKEVAYAVTGVAFDLHNQLGGLHREETWKQALAAGCREIGLENVDVEVPVIVRFLDFTKEYRLDLLVECGALFELKATAALHDQHYAQTLNYIHLTGLRRGKLLNFGGDQVESRFVSTTLSQADRRNATVKDDCWKSFDSRDVELKVVLIELVHDVGACLTLDLYREAVVHLLGGAVQVVRDVPISLKDDVIGYEKMNLHSPERAFLITGYRGNLTGVAGHLSRLLKHIPLEAIQWINLDKRNITFQTVERTD